MFGPSGPILDPVRADRFEVDRAILAERLPRMRHVIDDHGDAVARGIVDVDVGNEVVKEVELEMVFGPRYPSVLPVVREIGGRWVPHNDRHMYIPAGEFCLGLDHVDLPSVRTPEQFAVLLDQLLLFLRDQFTYDVLGSWPGPEWAHGNAAYAQHVVETLELANTHQAEALWPFVLDDGRPPGRCPCGSGLPYSRCHRDGVRQLRFIRQLSIRHRLPALIHEHIATSS